MLQESKCRYFIDMYLNRNISSFVVIILFLFVGCRAQRNARIQERQEVCLNTMFLASQTAGQPGFSGTFTLQASCSGSSNFSPSCIEYYAPSTREVNCPLGYTKSSVRCSVQNLVGICRFRPNDAPEEVRTAVFVRPNDEPEAARLYCENIATERIFTETYLAPGERSTSLNTVLTNGFLCYEQATKN